MCPRVFSSVSVSVLQVFLSASPSVCESVCEHSSLIISAPPTPNPQTKKGKKGRRKGKGSRFERRTSTRRVRALRSAKPSSFRLSAALSRSPLRLPACQGHPWTRAYSLGCRPGPCPSAKRQTTVLTCGAEHLLHHQTLYLRTPPMIRDVQQSRGCSRATICVRQCTVLTQEDSQGLRVPPRFPTQSTQSKTS